MINIASLYYFNLLQRLSPKYKKDISEVLKNITSYLREEWLQVRATKKRIWKYECITFKIHDVWSIVLFQKTRNEKKYYYYPSFFCNIYVKKEYFSNSEWLKKIIFLLSNIFECFDEFDEKNLLIEFHKEIESAYDNNKNYKLRHDFQNINSLAKIYNKTNITQEIQNFIEKNKNAYTISGIKNNFPDIYRTLIFFVYNIFAMQKTLASTEKQLQEIAQYEEKSWENMHVDISEERLKLNKKSLEKTLTLYKYNFENFINIMMYKG